MKICKCCGCTFDPEEEEELFNGDPYTIKNNLEGYYPSDDNLCHECALDEFADALPQGLEDLSYRLYFD